MRIYVITKGCYSDYQICGVTLTKEKAEKWAKYHSDSYDECTVEEYETENIDNATFDHLIPVYEVIFKKDGKFNVSICRYIDNKESYTPSFRLFDDLAFRARLTAKDPEHALKISMDKRAERLASFFNIR